MVHNCPKDSFSEIYSLYIEIFDELGVLLDKFLTGSDLVTHKDSEYLVCLYSVFHFDLDNGSALGVHCCFPELIGVHFTKTFITLNIDLGIVFARKLLDIGISFLIGESIANLLAASYLEKRRLGDINVAVRDELAHKAEEECQKQSSDMRTVDIGIRHNDYLAVAKL